jgi:hypothetical protein
VKRRLFIVLAAVVLLAASGCATAPALTDPQLQNGIAGLQQKVEAFLNVLGRVAGTPSAAYEQHAEFYGDIRADMRDLRTRAAASPATLTALDALQKSVDQVEAMHRDGIGAAEVPVIAGILSTQFHALLRTAGVTFREEF